MALQPPVGASPHTALLAATPLQRLFGAGRYAALVREFPKMRDELELRSRLRAVLADLANAERPRSLLEVAGATRRKTSEVRELAAALQAIGVVGELGATTQQRKRWTRTKPKGQGWVEVERTKEKVWDTRRHLYLLKRPPAWAGRMVPRRFQLHKQDGVFVVYADDLRRYGVEPDLANAIGMFTIASIAWQTVPTQRTKGRRVYFNRGHLRIRDTFGDAGRGNAQLRRGDVLLALLKLHGAGRGAQQVWDAYPKAERAADATWLRRRIHEEDVFGAATTWGIAADLKMRSPRGRLPGRPIRKRRPPRRRREPVINE